MSEVIFDAYRAFRSTPYGEKLSGSIRYEKYNLSSLSNEEWVRLLGSDVNNLTHMPLTRGLTKDFIKTTERYKENYFSEEEKVLLELAALIHDQGEAITGDISYGDKTENDEVEELRLFAQNADAFSGDISDDLKELIATARDQIVFNKESRLGRIFNAIERVGYLRTALRANDKVQLDETSEYADGLNWLIADVLSNQPLELVKYAEEYPAVSAYLTHQKQKITAAFIAVSPETFSHYGEKAETKLQEFVASFKAWNDWMESAG